MAYPYGFMLILLKQSIRLVGIRPVGLRPVGTAKYGFVQMVFDFVLEPVSQRPCALLKLDDPTSQCICGMH